MTRCFLVKTGRFIGANIVHKSRDEHWSGEEEAEVVIIVNELRSGYGYRREDNYSIETKWMNVCSFSSISCEALHRRWMN